MDIKLKTAPVLIETLWNVKQRSTRGATDGGAGFNRNIVECKGTTIEDLGVQFYVLIETLWNVKECRAEEKQSTWKVLIETLWNVKEQAAAIQNMGTPF